jgi:HEAT repeat protein
MRLHKIIFLSLFMILPIKDVMAQHQQTRIDSLVNLLRSAGREWNNYSIPLIEMGEAAVPALIRAVEDPGLSQWNRRISVMTLNDIHSPLWVKPALDILFDRNEDPVLRNQVTAGLKGFDLEDVKEELWEVFNELSDEFRKSNIAHLLLTADTAMAYQAFCELYKTDGYIKKTALWNLVKLRPDESTLWFLDGIQVEDWMTANLAMDSLVTSDYFIAEDLLSVYYDSERSEEIRWRIVYIFGHRCEPESIPLLLDALQEESWLIHTEAAVGLCRFTPKLVIPEIKALKKDPRSYVRNNSTWVIRQLKWK